jgi:hypothetical protein
MLRYIGNHGARNATPREERALARRLDARGNADAVISCCDYSCELKAEGGIVVGPVGAKPETKAQAGSTRKEPLHIDGGRSCMVGAPHVGADTVQHAAPADIGGMPTGAPSSRGHAQRRNRPPSLVSVGERKMQALGRGSEVERYKAALRRYRHEPVVMRRTRLGE